MSLSDVEKKLVAGLVSGYGTSESNATAEQLLKANPEAAEYHRQLCSLEAGLKSLVTSESQKDSAELPRLVASIRDAAHKRNARQKRVRRNVLTLSGIAATLALIIVPAFWLLTPRSLGKLVLIEQGDFLNDTRVPQLDREEIPPGKVVVTGNRWAAISLQDRRTAVLPASSELLILKSDHFQLRGGAVFISSPGSTIVECVHGTIRFEGGEMLVRSIAETARMEIYSGKARLTKPDGSFELGASSSTDWSRNAPGIISNSPPSQPPQWARKILQALSK
jgi:ferric-dicitrate binding protein FerR (iron transport regulator)